jgi:hypothetical protein
LAAVRASRRRGTGQPRLEILIEPALDGKVLVRSAAGIVALIFARKDGDEQAISAFVPPSWRGGRQAEGHRKVVAVHRWEWEALPHPELFQPPDERCHMIRFQCPACKAVM